MSSQLRRITRNQLAEFLPNQRLVKLFEEILRQLGASDPTDDSGTLASRVADATLSAGQAENVAGQAVDALGRIADALELLALAPMEAPAVPFDETWSPFPVWLESDNVTPPSPGGTLRTLADILIGSPDAGHLLIYDKTLQAWKNAVITPGSNVTITNADGAVTVSVPSTPPSGGAGGVLSGSYPNPGFAVDMATQGELDAHTGNISNPHSTTAAQVGADPSGTAASSMATHLGAADPHPQYALDTDLSAYAPLNSPNLVTPNIGAATATSVASSGDVTVNSTGKVGYTTGAGGSVTQATSKGTSVTINKSAGRIIMNNAALAAGATVGFSVNNSQFANTDAVHVMISSGATSSAYNIWAVRNATGVFNVNIKNISAGSLSEAIELTFVIIKGSFS